MVKRHLPFAWDTSDICALSGFSRKTLQTVVREKFLKLDGKSSRKTGWEKFLKLGVKSLQPQSPLSECNSFFCALHGDVAKTIPLKTATLYSLTKHHAG